MLRCSDAEQGLPFHFDVKSTLNVSDIAFYPSTSTHGFDLFATTVDKEDLLFLDLYTGERGPLGHEVTRSQGQRVTRTQPLTRSLLQAKWR